MTDLLGLIGGLGSVGARLHPAVPVSSSPSSCSSMSSAIFWWRAGAASRSGSSRSASGRSSSASTTGTARAGSSSAVPLGGYVRFLGDENEASVTDRAALAAMTPEERARSFPGKGVAARAAIVAAGPIANILLAVAIFASFALLLRRAAGHPAHRQRHAPAAPPRRPASSRATSCCSVDGRIASIPTTTSRR